MLETKQKIAKKGTLIARYPTDNQKFDYVFVYDTFRVFYSKAGKSLPFQQAPSLPKKTPDYVIELVYQFTQARNLCLTVLNLSDSLIKETLFNKNIKYIDIYLSKEPHSKAEITKSELVNFNFCQDLFYQVISVSLPRNLPSNTAVPLQVLFRLLLLNYAQAHCLWFIEGLTRWSQNLLSAKSSRSTGLPKNRWELKSLIIRGNGAESFWTHLISLCDKSDHSIKQLPGQRFIRQLLENIHQFSIPQKSNSGAQYHAGKCGNGLLLKALSETIVEAHHRNIELTAFINLTKPIAYCAVIDFDTVEIQKLMQVLKKIDAPLVKKDEFGILYSDYYEPYTKAITCPVLNLSNTELSMEDFDSFTLLESISGDLIIKDNRSISSLDGLRNLRFIGGRLVIDNLGLMEISEFSLLRTIGRLEIINNKKLRDISGFVSLTSVQENLTLANNSLLVWVSGFNSLQKINSGSLSLCKLPKLNKVSGFGGLTLIANCLHIEQCNDLKAIDFLNNLQSVGKVFVSRMENLGNLSSLKKVFDHSPHFDGDIKIVSCQLQDVLFMQNIQTIGGALFLSHNHLSNLKGLDGLKRIAGNFSLFANRITHLSHLYHLTEVGGMLDLADNKLNSLCGLESLQRLKNIKWNGRYRSIAIFKNEQLSDISALSNIRVLDSNFVVLLDEHQTFNKLPEKQSLFAANPIKVFSADYKKQFEREKVCAVDDWRLFEDIVQCSVGTNCHLCRNKKYGYAWRKKLQETMVLPPGGIDFKCPYGKQWSRFGYLTSEQHLSQLKPLTVADQHAFALRYSDAPETFPAHQWGKEIDVVYPFFAEAEDCHEDLRYSLRSLKNLDEKKVNVWIVGDKPEWLNLSTVNYIPHKKTSINRYIDSRAKVKLAVEHPDMGSHFIYMNDDLFFMVPVSTAFLGIPRYIADYTGDLESFKIVYDYHEHELKGLKEMEKRGLPLRNYNLHWPYVHNCHNFMKMYRSHRLDENGHNHETLYYNSYSKFSLPYSGELLRLNQRVNNIHTLAQLPTRVLVLNIKEHSLGLVQDLLEEQFSQASIYEK